MLDFLADPLVEPSWLAAHLADGDMRVVDARWRGDGTSRELYQQGHLPGAVHLDWQRDLSWTDGRGVGYLLLPPEPFAEVMEAVGIGDRTRVVAYAETDHSGAARLWWTLRYYGHDHVAVLNGGWTRWVAEGWPISTQVPRPAPTRFTPRKKHTLVRATAGRALLTGLALGMLWWFIFELVLTNLLNHASSPFSLSFGRFLASFPLDALFGVLIGAISMQWQVWHTAEAQ